MFEPGSRRDKSNSNHRQDGRTDIGSSEMTAVVASILASQRRLQQALATGSIPVREEVSLRAEMAGVLCQVGQGVNNTEMLEGAVQHYETILRRVPARSTEQIRYLESLAGAKTTQYMITGASQPLTQAVQLSQRARQLCTECQVEVDLELRSKVINTLAFAVSRRSALMGDRLESSDLDDAIVYTRELLSMASDNSQLANVARNNLASQLRRKFNQCQDVAYLQEAQDILAETLAQSSVSEPMLKAMIQAQLGEIAYDKYEKTKAADDLKTALDCLKTGLSCLQAQHDTRHDALGRLVQLQTIWYEQTKDYEDAKCLVDYSRQLLHATSANHRRRGEYLLQHLQRVGHFVVFPPSPITPDVVRTEVPNLGAINEAVEEAKSLLSRMSKPFAEKEGCLAVIANLQGGRYASSHTFHDLGLVIRATQDYVRNHNHSAERAEPSTASIFEDAWLYSISDRLSQAAAAPESNAMAMSLQSDLGQDFELHFNQSENACLALHDLFNSHRLRLEVVTSALKAEQDLSNEEVVRQIDTLRQKEKPCTKRDLESTKRPYRPPEFRTELGARKLNISDSGNLVFDLSGFMSSVLGFDYAVALRPDEFKAREERLEQESLEEARAKGQHPNVTLCRMCRNHTRPIFRKCGVAELTSRNSIMPHGNHHQLDTRLQCAICTLIKSVIMTSGKLLPRFAAMDREIQGTSLRTGYLSSGEKVLKVDFGMEYVTELRIVTKQNFRGALRQGWQIDATDAPFDMVMSSDPIDADEKQQVDLSMITSWLNECDHVHGSECNDPQFNVTISEGIPVTLIDVKDDRLVSSTTEQRYFALSYVWGQVEMSKTQTHSDKHARSRLGGLSTVPLPAVIVDAMTLVRDLGERYLWVDAICLVQGDAEEMARTLPQMDVIYGRAFTTIVALHGEDAASGLPGVQPGSRSPQKITRIEVSSTLEGLEYNPNLDGKDSIYLVASPRPLSLEVESTKWNSRGWIVQERLLSRRCLYFASNAVYFQCSRKTCCEGGTNELYKYAYLDKKDIMDNLKPAARHNPLDMISTFNDVTAHVRLQRAFCVYSSLVEDYTARSLTFKGDITRGFAGISAVLEKNIDTTTSFGIPEKLLLHSLLWTPAARLPRRGARLPSQDNWHMGKADSQFPSWSWAGWDGPVEFRIIEAHDGQAQLPKLLVRNHAVGRAPRSLSTSPPQDPEQQQSGGNATHDSDQSNDRGFSIKLVPDNARNSSWVISPPQASNSDPMDPAPESTILTLTAPAARLAAFNTSAEKEYLIKRDQVHTQSPQAIRRIYDRHGKHCGLWWEQAGYGYVGLNMSHDAEKKFHMVGISTTDDVYRPHKGPKRVEGEIRYFDPDVFPIVGKGSALVHVLVVDSDWEDGLGRRCTVAVLHVKAWEDAVPRELTLQIA